MERDVWIQYQQTVQQREISTSNNIMTTKASFWCHISFQIVCLETRMGEVCVINWIFYFVLVFLVSRLSLHHAK